MRVSAVPVLALLLIAASPADKNAAPSLGSMQRPAASVILPVPPMPPGDVRQMQEGFRPAPMADPDAVPPVDPETKKPHTELVPSLFAKPDHRPGDGYVPGSASAYDPDHRWHPSPSLTVKVPLQ